MAAEHDYKAWLQGMAWWCWKLCDDMQQHKLAPLSQTQQAFDKGATLALSCSKSVSMRLRDNLSASNSSVDTMLRRCLHGPSHHSSVVAAFVI